MLRPQHTPQKTKHNIDQNLNHENAKCARVDSLGAFCIAS